MFRLTEEHQSHLRPSPANPGVGRGSRSGPGGAWASAPVSNVLYLLESRAGPSILPDRREHRPMDAYSLYWQGGPSLPGHRLKPASAAASTPPMSSAISSCTARYRVPQPPGGRGRRPTASRPRSKCRGLSLVAGPRPARTPPPARILEANADRSISAMALAHRLHELDPLDPGGGYRTACGQLSPWLGYRHRRATGASSAKSSQLLAKVFRAIRDGGETPGTIRRHRDQRRRTAVARVRPLR